MKRRIAFASAIVVTTALLGFVLPSMDLLADWLAHCLLVAILLFLISSYTRKHHIKKGKDSVRRGHEAAAVGRDQPEVLQGVIGENQSVSARQARVFVLAVTNPSLVRQRVTDEYASSGRILHKRVMLELQLSRRLKPLTRGTGKDLGTTTRPQEQSRGAIVGQPVSSNQEEFPESVYLPIVIRKKGDFLDSLKVFDAKEELLPVLSYREYLLLAAAALRLLLVNACHKQAGGSLPEKAAAAERLALAGLVHRGFCTESRQAIKDILALDETVIRSKTSQQLAARFLQTLENKYAIVVSTRPDNNRRILFGYEETIIPALELVRRETSLVGWARDRLRLVLGARPVTINVTPENAWTCQSYHLKIDVADDLYLSDRHVKNLKELTRIDPRRGTVPPHYRFRRRLGQPYLHFYGRYLSEPGTQEADRQPQIRAQFAEVPPGTLFRAAVTATACLAIVWIVARMCTLVGAPDTDAPTFLLAFPVVAAAWLGYDAPTNRLFEGTLAARTSLLITAINAVLASGLFIAYKSDRGVLYGKLPASASFLGVRQVDWALLVILALVNFICISYCYFVRVHHFTSLVSDSIRSRKQ